jgi:hypothetical protein
MIAGLRIGQTPLSRLGGGATKTVLRGRVPVWINCHRMRQRTESARRPGVAPLGRRRPASARARTAGPDEELRQVTYRAPDFKRPKRAAGLRVTTLIAVWCCLGGCVSRSISFDSVRPLQSYDSSRNSITDLSSGIAGGVSLPHRALIRVDFTSGTDLRNMVARNVLFVHSYFCDRGDAPGTLGSAGVYVDRADAGRETRVNRFLFLMDVSRQSNPGSIPPESGFDLAVRAQDICFYVTARDVITTYKSKIAIIPKGSIEQAFAGWKPR